MADCPGDGDDLIGAIYEAALAPELWPSTLARIATALGADNGNLFVHDVERPLVDFFAASHLDQWAVTEYGDHFIRTDLWNPALLRQPSGRAYCAWELVDERAFERSEFNADFLRRLDLFHAVGGFAVRHGSRAVQVGFQRAQRDGHFEAHDAKLLSGLYAHFARAVTIHERLTLERLRADASAVALEQIPFGVILTDGPGRVLAANAAALQVVERGEIRLVAGRLAAADDLDDRRLAAAVRAAASASAPRSQTLALSRRGGRLPVMVAVLPATERLTLTTEAAQATVCLLIGDPERRDARIAPLLRELFDLTPAEARLASALGSGLSLSEIGAAHGISRETARGRLKVIFQKTGTSRQQDLLRLLLAIPTQPW